MGIVTSAMSLEEVTITKGEYFALKEAAAALECLEMNGCINDHEVDVLCSNTIGMERKLYKDVFDIEIK